MEKTDIPKQLKAGQQGISMVKTIFWLLVLVFLFILCEFFVPAVRNLFRGSLLFLAPFVLFSLLGVVLVVLAIREKIEKKLKAFLTLTGASSAGFFICVLLHNVVYGLFIFIFGQGFWDRIGIGDEPVFFILAIFVCPIGLLVGIIGSIVMLIKQRKG